MKRLFLGILMHAFLACIASAAPTPFVDNLNTLWLQGNKTLVLGVANQRLQADPNDVVALLIQLDYQIEYSDVPNLKVTIDKFLLAGEAVKSKCFSTLFPQIKSDLMYLKTKVIPLITPQMAQADKAKGDIAGKPLSFLEFLRAAELDGLTR